MAIEGLDARQQLAVVAARDEHLGVRAHGGLEDGERAGCEFVFFQLGDLVFADRGVRERRRGKKGREGKGSGGNEGLKGGVGRT